MLRIQIKTPAAIGVHFKEITVPVDRYPQGYEAGFADGTEVGIEEGLSAGKAAAEAENAATLVRINAALAESGGRYIQEGAPTLADVPEKVPYVYDNGFEHGFTKGLRDGKAEEADRFWDSIQAHGTRVDYNCAFRFWQDEEFHPKYKVAPSGTQSAASMFQWMQNLKKLEEAYVDLSGVTGENGRILCNRCDALEEVEDIGFNSTLHYYYTFQGCANLKKIAKINCSASTAWTSPFGGCVSLEDVTFSGTNAANGLNLGACTKLSGESIESAISVLSASTTGKSITLSKTAVDTAFQTIAGSAPSMDGSTSAKWAALVGTKPNWTISLV